MNGNVGYLELLLTSENVKDFLNRKDMIQSITDHDKELIKFMKEQKDIVDNKKNELQGQRASVEVTKSKLESRRNDLIKVTREKEVLMSSLEKDIKAAEIAYDKATQEYKDLGAQILKLQQETGPYSGGKMLWPVPSSGRITSYYGYRIHPIFKSKKLHTGIDIGVPTGSSIVAASEGRVIHSDWLGSYGKAVLLDHGGGIVTLYAHNSTLTVKKGQWVERGNTIAKAGSTGNSTGPHLHFEVRKNGAYVDPLPWVKGK
jgi:murein DD-endopeptidase MepM/ murein hydrolase activator NlpD